MSHVSIMSVMVSSLVWDPLVTPPGLLRPRTCADWVECVSLLRREFKAADIMSGGDGYNTMWLFRIVLVPGA